MGRTRRARAQLEELKKIKDTSKSHKNELIKYLQKLKNHYTKGELSYYDYEQILKKNLKGKTIPEWFDHYDDTIDFCEKEIKKFERKILKNRLLFFIISLLIGSLITAFILYSPISLTGLSIREIQDQPSINKVYDFFKGLFSTITGRTVEEPVEPIEELPSEPVEEQVEPYSEEIEKEAGQEPSPSQDQPLPSETNETEEPIEEAPEEIPEEPIEEAPEEIPEEPTEEIPEEVPEEPVEEPEVEKPIEEIDIPILIRDIPDIEIEKNKIIEISLNEYFSNADNYFILQARNIFTTIEDSKIKIQPEKDFLGTRTIKIIAMNDKGQKESNFFDIVVSEVIKSPILIRNIPDIEIKKNSEKELSLSEYFKNADQFFILQVKGISTTSFDHTINFKPEKDFTGTRETKIIVTNDYGQIQSNSFKIIITDVAKEEEIPEILPEANITEIMNETGNISISTIQYGAVLGQPVKWKKHIQLERVGEVRVELPRDAENIIVNKILERKLTPEETAGVLGEPYSEEIEKEAGQELSPSQPPASETEQVEEPIEEPIEEAPEEIPEEIPEEVPEERKAPALATITGMVVKESAKEEKSLISSILEAILNFFKKGFGAITGRAITTEQLAEITEVTINDLATEYEIEYETPAPYSIEEDIPRGKRITISGPDTTHYENVLAYTNLTKEVPENKIKLYRTTNGIREITEISNYLDENNNGLIDKIEWLVPSLSEQTYELIIEISKAEHLDENKIFISDIYEQVRALDGNWSEPITDQHYVRVTFNKNLTSDRDITIYPRVTSGTPKIEVYENNGNEKIAEFSFLNSNQYNKIFLTNLISESQDVFDLKVVGGSIEIEHIVDPLYQYYLIGGHVTGSGGTGTLNTVQGSATAQWKTSGATDSFTWTKQYPGGVTTDAQTYIVGFWCNTTQTGVGGSRNQIDELHIYDCGTSSTCATQDVEFCSVTIQNIECLVASPTYREISCTDASSRALGAGDYIGVRLIADVATNKAPILLLFFNSTTYPSYVNITETEIDTTFPDINVTSPFNATNWSTNDVDVNYTVSDANLNTCWFTNSSGISNTTITCGTNLTSITWIEGVNNITIYANDSGSNINSSSTQFRVDTINPNINITGPFNGTNYSFLTVKVNYTVSDSGLGLNTCWFTNTSGRSNETITCGTNLTTYTWLNGVNNITIYVNDSIGNRNSSSVTFNATQGNTAPQITSIFNSSDAGPINLNEGPSNTNITFNFSAFDAEGVGDLNNATAFLNITRGGTTRGNSSVCHQYQASGNYANYTCTIQLWWFDQDGVWNINASISDASSLNAANDTINTIVNTLTAFKMGPVSLSFASINAGATNTSATNNLILNNTGNQNITEGNIDINATSLLGEINSNLALFSGNFTVSNDTTGTNECDLSGRTAVQMNQTSGGSFVKVNGTLQAGNYTINDGTAQEQLYVCLFQAGSELSQQAYSTAANRAWTIRVLLSVLTIGGAADRLRRKKKKRQKTKQETKEKEKPDENKFKNDNLVKAITLIMEELKAKYSLSKAETINEILEIKRKEIPTNIFSKKLGALESLTKYMKENLGMSYHKIAKELNRDERTIWTAYNKAKQKQKEPIEIKDVKISIPIEIFKDRKLTILESAIIYLREKEMKHKDIARLLQRDPRNIQAIYSRAVRKIKENKG